MRNKRSLWLKSRSDATCEVLRLQAGNSQKLHKWMKGAESARSKERERMRFRRHRGASKLPGLRRCTTGGAEHRQARLEADRASRGYRSTETRSRTQVKGASAEDTWAQTKAADLSHSPPVRATMRWVRGDTSSDTTTRAPGVRRRPKPRESGHDLGDVRRSRCNRPPQSARRVREDEPSK